MTDNPSKYLGNEFGYVSKVLNSENWSATAGRWNQVLEHEFAKKIGVKHAIAMNSGTATLHAALEAVGVGYGDEVISPALTVIMNTTATLHANAIPVYVDVDPDTFNIDPVDLENKITDKTKAIMTVSLYGLSPDMDAVMEIANKYNIPVIEDNAQSMVNTYKGRNVGSLADIASYSFENTKHLSCGEGGIVVTDNAIWAEKMRKVGGHGFKNLTADEGRVRLKQDVFQNPDYKRHDSLGWNYRLSEFNAAIALAQLERAEELVTLRQETAEIFLDVMSSCDYLIPQKFNHEYTHSYYTLGIKYLGAEKNGVSWQDFRRQYIENGGDGFYGAWSVPYLEPLISERIFAKRLPIYKDIAYEKGLCPVAEEIQPQIMQFKTNYRDVSLAKVKAEALRKTIQQLR